MPKLRGWQCFAKERLKRPEHDNFLLYGLIPIFVLVYDENSFIDFFDNH